MTITCPAPHRRASQKPTIDGLEERWAQVWEDDGTYRFDRHPGPRRRLLHRHPAADRERVAARRPRVLVHPHRLHRPLPAHARATRSSTRWAGTTTACRPSGGCRTTSACAATRRCRTTPTSSRRTKPDKHQIPISRRNFIELCERLTVEDEKAFEELWRRLGLSVDWSHDLPDHRRRRPRRVAAGVPAQPRPRRGLPGRGADAVGRHVPHRGRAGRARGPRAPGRLPPHRLPPRPTASRSSSRRRGPSCSPPAWRWSRTPTTSATSRCSAPR